jgi:hypothetical protein
MIIFGLRFFISLIAFIGCDKTEEPITADEMDKNSLRDMD